ncbi:DUF5715 family protein [Epilithonimonas sp. JDS]|uniref:DUF5715 family protein n=1 Tax=Epilithonimonas sp. JDS TaxID=2902797 RepID=UPI001E638977|nr:DUF5715 family protein [Epilithonimonas sp. JDS]MCD9854954.1 DUF5715 family protein [Epilithonimonas sp. JDS]
MAALSAFHSLPILHRDPPQVGLRDLYVYRSLPTISKFCLSIIFLLSFSLFKSQKCYDLKEVLKVEPTTLYKPHLLAAQNFGVDILENAKSVDKYISKGKFVKVKKKSRGYRLQALEYSRPYLVKKARTTLENMAAKFATDTKSFFVVSSVTRTLEDQCRLRKVNSNAALGISSHNYGAAFDISYVRFDHVLKVNTKLEKELEKVLLYYKNLGHIFYIKEKQQSCYHVTVRRY